MKKLTVEQLKNVIKNELQRVNEDIAAQPQKKSAPPPIPAAAKKQGGGRSTTVDQHVQSVKQAISKLGQIVNEIDTGSDSAGMSSYYVGTELEKVVKSLIPATIFFKKNGQA